MIETSSVPLRKSSATFGNLRQYSENVWKMFGDVRQASGTILENLRKLVNMNFIFSCSTRYLEDKIHIHAQACNILYIYSPARAWFNLAIFTTSISKHGGQLLNEVFIYSKDITSSWGYFKGWRIIKMTVTVDVIGPKIFLRTRILGLKSPINRQWLHLRLSPPGQID